MGARLRNIAVGLPNREKPEGLVARRLVMQGKKYARKIRDVCYNAHTAYFVEEIV